jgi:hypothetical protein
VAYPEPPESGRPKMDAVYEMVRFVTVYGTLAFLALLGFYLVSRAFGAGFYPGIRSFASALLPLVIASFLYLFNREILRRFGALPTAASFLAGAALGVLLMAALRHFASSGVPLTELIVSGAFSVLVFSSDAARGDRPLAAYYGAMSGMLGYIILLGFPSLG